MVRQLTTCAVPCVHVELVAAAVVGAACLADVSDDVQAKLTKNPAGYTLWCKELLGR